MSFPHYSMDCHEYHSLVRDFGGPRPTITVLCGSTRFRDAFEEAARTETLAGRIVLSAGLFGWTTGVAPEEALGAQIKADLDELHKRKIDLADEVLVLNVGGYIGQSTRAEINYAEKVGRPVRYLEPTDTEGAAP